MSLQIIITVIAEFNKPKNSYFITINIVIAIIVLILNYKPLLIINTKILLANIIIFNFNKSF
jgi:hypothetical protein